MDVAEWFRMAGRKHGVEKVSPKQFAGWSVEQGRDGALRRPGRGPAAQHGTTASGERTNGSARCCAGGNIAARCPCREMHGKRRPAETKIETKSAEENLQASLDRQRTTRCSKPAWGLTRQLYNRTAGFGPSGERRILPTFFYLHSAE